MPVLQPPFYFIGTHRVVENITRFDWDLPGGLFRRPGAIRVIDEPMRIYGIRGEGKVLWLADSYNVRHAYEIGVVARCNGFTIKHTEEYLSWLTAITHDFLQAQANAGLPALEASVLRQLSVTLTTAAKPAGKAQ